MMRSFVVALVQTGRSATDAAEIAGYSASNRNVLQSRGSQLAHDARVQAAILEECQKLIRADGPMALTVLRTIAKDTTAPPRDRLKAATEILNRGGFHAVTQHNVTVTHQTEKEKDREILALATELGLDDAAKAKLLGKPVTVDAEFTEIVDPPTDVAPPRGPAGAKITNAERSPEERAAERARYRETPEERQARQEHTRQERRERAKREYAEAVIGRAGLEDLLDPLPEPQSETDEIETEGASHE